MSQEQVKEELKEELNPDLSKEKEMESHVAMPASMDPVNVSGELVVNESSPISTTGWKCIGAYLAILFVMHLWGKILMSSYRVTPFEILYARGVVSVIMSLVYLKQIDVYLFSVETNKSSMVLGGALLGFLSLSGFYIALYNLNLSDAFALDSLSGLTAIFVDFMAFKMIIRFSHKLAYLFACIGVVLLARPSFLFDSSNSNIEQRKSQAIGIIAGLLGAIFSGLHGGIIRRTCSKVNPLISFTFQQFAMALFSPCIVLVHFELRQSPTAYTFFDLVSLLAIGVLSWFANYFLYNALHEEKIVSRVYSYKYVLVILGVLVDPFFARIGGEFSAFIGDVLLGCGFAAYIYGT